MSVVNKEGDVKFHMKINSVLARKGEKVLVDNKTDKGYFFCIYKEARFHINPSLLPSANW